MHRRAQLPNGPGKALRDLGRAAGGALVFALPMLMTTELWVMGFYLDRLRLFTLLVTAFPLLVLLSRHIGFESTSAWADDILDSFLALGLSCVVCAILLAIFGVIDHDTPAGEIVGKIAIQMIPAAIGALLAKSAFSSVSAEKPPVEREETYGGELFLMMIGALFLGFNVAPTEDVMIISYQITEWHSLLLVVLSITIMHGFVFAVGFAGGSEVTPEEPWWSPFIRLTLPGYVIAFSASLYLLWIFARTDGLSVTGAVMAAIVLAFPSAIGAAGARLIL